MKGLLSQSKIFLKIGDQVEVHFLDKDFVLLWSHL